MTAHQRYIEVAGALPAPAEGYFAPAHPGFYARHIKRPFDVLVVLLLAPIVVPLILLLMLLVSLDGHAPLFRQKRVGRNGDTYSIFKLRTMVPNAEEHLQKYLAENHEAMKEWTEYQKLSHDPRITFLGRLLRKSSLDELPQLWNVLIGEMSLIGPRPMMLSQRPMYPGVAYYELRPGITGPWQVSGRSLTTFKSRAVYDESYYRELSLATDMHILARTVVVVLRATGT